MSNLEQRVVICFLALKGLQHKQIQTELSDGYHGEAFQLPVVEK
jgi:hypothetical protein